METGMRRALLLILATVSSCKGLDGTADGFTAITPETHTFFPINTGAHAGIDCNSCHGAFDSFKGFDCLTCHTQPQCDPIHLGMPGYAFQNPKCLSCHPDGTKANIDHTLFFPTAAGQTHQNIACVTCHTDPANRKVFDCVSCHTKAKTDPWHAGVTGYAWSSPQCYQCHPTSNIPDFAHSAFPVDAAAVHKNIGCSQCHADAANLKTIDCVTCHPSTTNSPKHANVGGFTSATASCLRCHGDSQVNPVAAHLPFSISAGAHHSRSSCVRCHPSYRTDKTFAADFTVKACLTCHGNVHAGQYADAQCLNCHSRVQ